MEQQSTIDEQDPRSNRSGADDDALALVIAWCADAQWRVGEIAWICGEPRVLGRGSALEQDPSPRLMFMRQRPTRREAAAPLSLPTLSRVQCIISACGLDRVTIRNVGRAPLFVDQTPVTEASLHPGQTMQLGRQLLLLCVRRAVALPCPSDEYPLGAFGTADGHGIVGESPAIWHLRKQLAFVGPRAGHVLLLGASGAGKELSARAVHALSDRKEQPLVARNAATIPESLVDAELFGNAKNYPNAGMLERPGLIGEANAATLFLDEIGELPAALQGHLLRVLDGGEYHRLGESASRRANLRVIAATNRDLSALKPDLLARFAFRIEVPDLNGRREDIPLLASHLLRRAIQADPHLVSVLEEPESESAPVSIALCSRLLLHMYTLHTRELERLLFEALVEQRSDTFNDAPSLRQGAAAPEDRQGRPAPFSTTDHQGSLTPARIQAALDESNGRLELAYRALGLKNRFALSRLIAKHGLEVRRRSKRPLARGPSKGG